VKWQFLPARAVRWVRRRLWLSTARVRARRRGIRLGPENFCLRDSEPLQVLVDAGVGKRPTFAPWVRTWAKPAVVLVDPTPKHIPALRGWVELNPLALLLEAAIAAQDGELTFFESDTEESGSLDPSHVNTMSAGRRVTVSAWTLDRVIEAASKLGPVSAVKLDLEGAEFDVLNETLDRAEATILCVPQWFIEFHPRPQTQRRLGEVFRLRDRFLARGFEAYSPNGVDYLFSRPTK
jgi:FkbM family methyltransferase